MAHELAAAERKQLLQARDFEERRRHSGLQQATMWPGSVFVHGNGLSQVGSRRGQRSEKRQFGKSPRRRSGRLPGMDASWRSERSARGVAAIRFAVYG